MIINFYIFRRSDTIVSALSVADNYTKLNIVHICVLHMAGEWGNDVGVC